MKVLFAVSSESISDAIIKKYQREYKEILSYKNVYYFNAILKEIQRDKTYDRIIISEDLEPFSNNNYETIDKFIFEKLDSISDEAQDSHGKETSIILICTDRHTKGSSILVKLFGIGVYNALLGNDRSMEQVCQLINKPRNKKEAKMYYKIDTDDVNYKAESENEVSELEIQNILTHFKKLGKNKERYADSFNNIASQYTDEQLKIIINCLPITIKGVLEEECPKYQEIMSVNGSLMSVKRSASKLQEDKEKTGIKIDIIENKLTQSKPTGPIVIPSSVKTSAQKREVMENIVKPKPIQPIKEEEVVEKLDFEEELLPGMGVVAEEETEELLPGMFSEINEGDNDNSIDVLLSNTETVVDEEEVLLPGMEAEEVSENIKKSEEEPKPTQVAEPVKRGRGRPRIKPIDEMPKPKGKRGRPRKIVPQEENISIETVNENSEEELLPGMFEEIEEDNDTYTEEVSLPGLDELDDLDDVNSVEEEADDSLLREMLEEDETLLPGMEIEEEGTITNNSSTYDEEFDEDNASMISQFGDTEYEDDNEETLLPGMGFEKETEDIDDNLNIGAAYSEPPTTDYNDTTSIESIKSTVDYSMSSLNSLLTKDKKIVTFLGTTKNGTSFLINNLAALFSSLGINTAVLDMTQNRNSYYIYTQNEEEQRKIAYNSVEKLQNGFAEGIKVDKNLTVYTSLPNDGKDYSNAEPILSTLVQNHSLILIDCDFETDPSYFANCQEIYLVQSMDILTIQPLTAFLRELKTKGVLEPEKVRVVINKEIKVKSLTSKVIIGGMSFYNDPAMSFMTELFNKDMVKACSIPFEDAVYSKYLESMVNCNVSLSGYSKAFLSKLRILGDMVYPLTSKQTYGKTEVDYRKNNFSNSMNNTLNQMKKKY